MNLLVENVFQQIQAKSHEVTLSEVSLFSYKNKEIYQKLASEVSKENFVIFNKIFFVINKVAYECD